MLARRVADYVAQAGADVPWAQGVVSAAPDDFWSRAPVLVDPCAVLPQELVVRVLACLPPVEVLHARCVSKLWAQRCTDEGLWRQFVHALGDGRADVGVAPQPHPWSWMMLFFARTGRSTTALIDTLHAPPASRPRHPEGFDADWDDDDDT